jgi:hypothetical protein
MVPDGRDARRARLLKASSGDEDHVRRLELVLARADRHGSGDVPRESGDPRERVPVGVLEEARRPGMSREAKLAAVVCGALTWVAIAAVYELVRWLA